MPTSAPPARGRAAEPGIRAAIDFLARVFPLPESCRPADAGAGVPPSRADLYV